jgi:nucleoside-diphosphate-sugar epimerase
MTTPQHIVLGSTGVVGRETLAALATAGIPAVSVSRAAAASPAAPAGTPHVSADLRDAAAVRDVLDSAEVAYLTVGLPYSLKAWRADWPVVVRTTIDACVANGTHLVYLDNVYAYGETTGPMTETTPVRPTSRKGEVRASLLRMLDAAARDRGLVVTVGRSADFYGPGAATSVFTSFALDAIRAGRKPTWLVDAHQPHSMTYTRDIATALVTLGTDARARGGVWHLPTAPALTGEEYLALATDGTADYRTMSATTMRIGALFNAAARESLELAYQNDRPYLFDSSAFEHTFGGRPTPYAEGIRASLAQG